MVNNSVNTTFTANAAQYISVTVNATHVTNQFVQAQARAQAAQSSRTKGGIFGSFGKGIDDFSKSAKDVIAALQPLETVVKTIVGVGVAGAAAGVGLMRQAAEFDSLRQSLVAVEGSADKAKVALRDLKEIAKAPGIGFEEAVRGFTGLRNAGLGERFSRDLITQLANANARGGGNAESFGRILRQIQQSANRPYLSQADLYPIAEAGVPINKILRDRFGTGDTEQLKAKGIDSQTALRGIVQELAKLPRVAGGAQNEFDNLGDALKFMGEAAGEGLNKGLLPYFSKLSNAASELTDSGVIESAFSKIAENVIEMLGGASDDLSMQLTPAVAGIVTVSDGFRNLTENMKGLLKLLQDLENKLKWIPGVAAARALRNRLSKDDDGVDTSLTGDYERNLNNLQTELEAYRKIRKSRERRGLNADGSPKKALEDDGPSVPARVEPLLQRIAVATEGMRGDMQTRLSGGSTEARNVTGQYGLYRTLHGHGEMVEHLQAILDMFSMLQGGVTVATNRGRIQ